MWRRRATPQNLWFSLVYLDQYFHDYYTAVLTVLTLDPEWKLGSIKPNAQGLGTQQIHVKHSWGSGATVSPPVSPWQSSEGGLVFHFRTALLT